MFKSSGVGVMISVRYDQTAQQTGDRTGTRQSVNSAKENTHSPDSSSNVSVNEIFHNGTLGNTDTSDAPGH